jgi:hypothetical protein
MNDSVASLLVDASAFGMESTPSLTSLQEPSAQSVDISDIFSVQHNYAHGWFIGRMHEGKISCMVTASLFFIPQGKSRVSALILFLFLRFSCLGSSL